MSKAPYRLLGTWMSGPDRSTYDSSKLQTGAAAWSQGIAKYLRPSLCVVTVLKLGVVLVVVVDDEELRDTTRLVFQ